MTEAEKLLTLAREVLYPRGTLIVPYGCRFEARHFARIKLALDFERRSKAFQLMALMEEWDAQRIIREMY